MHGMQHGSAGMAQHGCCNPAQTAPCSVQVAANMPGRAAPSPADVLLSWDYWDLERRMAEGGGPIAELPTIPKQFASVEVRAMVVFAWPICLAGHAWADMAWADMAWHSLGMAGRIMGLFGHGVAWHGMAAPKAASHNPCWPALLPAGVCASV